MGCRAGTRAQAMRAVLLGTGRSDCCGLSDMTVAFGEELCNVLSVTPSAQFANSVRSFVKPICFQRLFGLTYDFVQIV